MDQYDYHSTCFDKEVLRMKTLALNEKSINYKLVNKSGFVHARAPLSGYFEVEIHINKNHFDEADKLLNSLTGE